MSRTRVTVGLVGLAVGVAVLIAAIAGSGNPAHRRASGSFAWLRPAAAPAGWKIARTAGGSTFSYPPGWQAIKTDAGTTSVALLRGASIVAYVNATPKQGSETLANWTRFRTGHNRGEGDRTVRVEASISNAPFRSGRASCVIDTYRTSKAAYREIACLVSGPGSSAVVVAAAPIRLWNHEAVALERAASSFVP
jgi:hypothetical protein